MQSVKLSNFVFICNSNGSVFQYSRFDSPINYLISLCSLCFIQRI